MKKIIFATKNKGKLKEVEEIFKRTGINILSLLDFDETPEIIENGVTFTENAKIKTDIIYEKYKIPVMGDDSGLVVEQLKGAPGVYSARYAGESATDDQNNRKLISELLDLPKPHKAKFVCAAVFFDGKDYQSTYGELHGEIIESERGSHGFGYDPLFIPTGKSETTAEISLEEKNKISHRSKAFNKLKDLITK